MTSTLNTPSGGYGDPDDSGLSSSGPDNYGSWFACPDN